MIAKRLWGVMKRDAVLSLSFLCAFVSCLFVPPSLDTLSYIDFRTLGLLFCLMLVIAGFRKASLFHSIGCRLLKRSHTRRQVVGVLVFLCFFCSMLITNDVALITFVPFSIMVLQMAGMADGICMSVVLLTIAANLGSMFTPIGNPQNLYLFALSQSSFFSFLGLMFPYTLAAGALLALCVFVCNRREPLQVQTPKPPCVDLRAVTFDLLLFALCLLSVAGIIDRYALVLVVVLAVAWQDRALFLQADYALLATFVFFFVFIGNMNQVEWLHQLILGIVDSHERIVAVLLSQLVSNVPAAMLLSQYTTSFNELIIGVNLGGLGTLIASMASLISYKQIAAAAPLQKGRYLCLFTMMNVLFLLLLFWI